MITLTALKTMTTPAMGNGRPSPTLTDKEWQDELKIRRLFVDPYSKRLTRMPGRCTADYLGANSDVQRTYHGETNYQSYCTFMNSVLRNIRNGQVDYCFYKYQILDLLRFSYVSLRTRYIDGYWEVWLEK